MQPEESLDFPQIDAAVGSTIECVKLRVAIRISILFSAGAWPMPTNRNILYLIIGALVVVAGVLGYNLYQEKKQPDGLQINVGPGGVSIEKK